MACTTFPDVPSFERLLSRVQRVANDVAAFFEELLLAKDRPKLQVAGIRDMNASPKLAAKSVGFSSLEKELNAFVFAKDFQDLSAVRS